jgi:hypothetical protein
MTYEIPFIPSVNTETGVVIEQALTSCAPCNDVYFA